MNVGGKKLSDGVTDCFFIAGMENMLRNGETTWDLAKVEKGRMTLQSTNTYGWDRSERRIWCNTTFKSAIPSSISSIFVQHINKTSAGNRSTEIVDSVDYFAIPAFAEVYGTSANTYKDEGSLWTYYETQSNKIKYLWQGEGRSYWFRTPNLDATTSYICATTDAERNIPTTYGANETDFLSLFGCIG